MSRGIARGCHRKLADETGRATADLDETGLDRGARLLLGGGIPRQSDDLVADGLIAEWLRVGWRLAAEGGSRLDPPGDTDEVLGDAGEAVAAITGIAARAHRD